MTLEGKAAFVSGAGSGIGQQSALLSLIGVLA
jgi:NAD(P)-dependent dehydrogenase (short-subunit alcohol dehydrogenase family)